MTTFEVHVVQYLYPSGGMRHQITDLPVSYQDSYEEMQKAGFRLEAEMLRTDEIYVSINQDDLEADGIIAPNGPQVQEAYGTMLQRRRWTLFKDVSILPPNPCPDPDP